MFVAFRVTELFLLKKLKTLYFKNYKCDVIYFTSVVTSQRLRRTLDRNLFIEV